MKWVQKRFKQGCTWNSLVTQDTKRKLDMLQQEARQCDILFSGGDEFEVNEGTSTYVVLLSRRSCSCGVWDLCGIPCKHATSAINYKKMQQSITRK
ncbi:hypothetical protein ACSBR1_036326 [Camellia fascicularis]